ncbi:unknown protein [Oryza sativa Japonica Group]|uniref:Uncharacterized protein n=5 Tax=Oryza TaxID=4527 RepID=Q5N9V7_ORYSJ|nr:unknown protein [Oryza sativa Japonica Group]
MEARLPTVHFGGLGELTTTNTAEPSAAVPLASQAGGGDVAADVAAQPPPPAVAGGGRGVDMAAAARRVASPRLKVPPPDAAALAGVLQPPHEEHHQPIVGKQGTQAGARRRRRWRRLVVVDRADADPVHGRGRAAAAQGQDLHLPHARRVVLAIRHFVYPPATFQPSRQNKQMVQDGWPLGLGAMNARAGVTRSVDLSGSASFSTAFTSSHCASSSFTSCDFDTESAWSLSRRGGGGAGGGMTLASLIGLVDAMESRSRRRRSARATSKSGKVRALLLSLCLRSHLENGRAAPSLGQFLEMERRASSSSL